MSNKVRFDISEREYDALFMMRGLAQSAHEMVMCAENSKTGTWVLEGDSIAFVELSADLFDEIYAELSPKSRLKYIIKLYERLNPDCEIF